MAQKFDVKHIVVNAEDASRTHIDYLIKFARAAKKAAPMVGTTIGPPWA